ncbi:MAG TPA: heavy metal translocating P-type ATPase, partial [Pelagibacterium sp.]|nr:heavy metal translocating P-type ATPase [Pelagibacterium sp.]
PRVFGGSQAIPGKAVTARLQEGFVSVGSPRYAAEQMTIPVDIAQRMKSLEDEGKTVVVVLAAKALIGLIALRDEPRADAVSGIASLSALGLRSVMLTGDNSRTAAAIAGTLGITAKSELMPDAKLDEIGNLRKAGGVAMVG